MIGRKEESCGCRGVDGSGVHVGGIFLGGERLDGEPADERDLPQSRPLEEEEGSTDSGEDGFLLSTEILGSVGPEVDADGVEVREEGDPVGGGETVEEGSGDGEGVKSDGCRSSESWR